MSKYSNILLKFFQNYSNRSKFFARILKKFSLKYVKFLQIF